MRLAWVQWLPLRPPRVAMTKTVVGAHPPQEGSTTMTETKSGLGLAVAREAQTPKLLPREKMTPLPDVFATSFMTMAT